VVTGKSAGAAGGGIFVTSGAALNLDSSTVSGNSAPVDPDIHQA
jgi:hypothetical protein